MPPAAASSASQTDSIRNHLLAALAPDDLARLHPRLEPAALSLGEAPTEPGRPIAHVFFPEAGIVSILAVAPDKRPGISLAVRALETAGLIRHARSRITVLDRAGLETAAGGCYGAPEAEHARLFGPPR